MESAEKPKPFYFTLQIEESSSNENVLTVAGYLLLTEKMSRTAVMNVVVENLLQLESFGIIPKILRKDGTLKSR